ncbi:SpoIIE family protein phosphatase [Candidatus Poribacteria bacterium]|nr:SpoIIE family protein phosphatase [Candidatus Poribacteria bacterium]
MNTYTVADGLVGPIVPIIYQDSRGTLWLGSDRGGVSYFDGSTFHPLSGNSEKIRGKTKNIVEDKWGHIWFLSKHQSEAEGIISRYNGSTLEFISTGNCMAVDRDGDIWIGGNNIITQYISFTNEEIPQPYNYNITSSTVAKVNVIYPTKEGTLWIGGNDAQGIIILRFKDEIDSWQTTNFERLGNLPDIPKDRSIESIIEDNEGNLWFAGRQLLLRFDNTQIEEIVSNSMNAIPSTTSQSSILDRGNVSVKIDRHGRIWYNDKSQLSWWDGKALQRLRNYSRDINQDFFLQGSFEIEDAWDKLWFATKNGAFSFDTKFFEPNKNTIFQFDPTLTGTSELLQNVYQVDNGLGSDNIQTIFESMDGKIWFGHDNGVTVFEPQPAIVNHTTRSVLGSNSVRLIYPDSTGTLWFSIPGGIAKYLTDDEILYPTAIERKLINSDTLRNQRVSRRTEIIKIFEVEGELWLMDKPYFHQDGFTTYRFYRKKNDVFDSITIKIKAEVGPGGEITYSDSDPLLTSNINPWIVIGGILFYPNTNGLYRLTTEGIVRSTSFNSTDSLSTPTNAIIALYNDSTNRLWCYYDSGEIKRFSNIKNKFQQISSSIQAEVLPYRSFVPIPSISSTDEVRWFYNTISGQLVYLESPEQGNVLTEVPGAASGKPLLSVQNTISTNEVNGTELHETTFVLPDSIKTYQGTELKNSVSVSLTKIEGALTTNEGDLWLATSQGAIHYNGEIATTYTTENGFLVDDLRDIHEDNWGNIWFATWGGGVVRFDGETFQSITTKNGLIHNNVSDIHASESQELWFATEGGATQYRPSLGALPFCKIESVKTDGKEHSNQDTMENVDSILSDLQTPLPSNLKDLTIEFKGISPLRDAVDYKFKLIGVGKNTWTTYKSDHKTALETRINEDVIAYFQPQDDGLGITSPHVRYEGLKSGKYSFLITAFRKGWPYTQRPAVLNFTIDQPVLSRSKKYLPTVVFLLAVASLGFRLIVNRRQTAQLRLEMREKEEAEMIRIRAELNEAQNIQMGLLPTEPPETQSFDIAAMSIPATQVGGDFFDYVSLENGLTAIAVADAAGKGIRGAMNAVLTNGMLHEVARVNNEADIILRELNSGLSPRMYGPSFIALNLAILSDENNMVDYANGGQPYPILKRGTEAIEIETSDLPLGSRNKVDYESISFELLDGDYLIFHTDGLIEALNKDEDMYGTDRLKEFISNIPNDDTAEEVIKKIVDEIQSFVQDAEQYDDLTLVVVKKI